MVGLGLASVPGKISLNDIDIYYSINNLEYDKLWFFKMIIMLDDIYVEHHINKINSELSKNKDQSNKKIKR